MRRREFLKTAGASGLMTFITPQGLVQALSPDKISTLEEGFSKPPPSARPHSYYFFMNGQITADGITRDFEAMKRVGIGGVINFSGGVAIPRGTVDVLSPEWIALTQRAVQEAKRLGLDYAMHSCPGWSSSGGPWITPELSMQKVVWSERYVIGGRKVHLNLEQPFTRLDYYRDSYVIAFPSTPDEQISWNEHLVQMKTNTGVAQLSQLTGGKGLDLYPPDARTPAYLLLEFSVPMKSQSILVNGSNITSGATGSYRMPAFVIESSDDGVQFRTVYSVPGGANGDPTGASYPVTSAKYYRLSFKTPVHIDKLNFFSSARLDNWLIKANYCLRPAGTVMVEPAPYAGKRPRLPIKEEESIDQDIPSDAIVSADTVLDISRFMSPDGTLNWDAPEGRWTILRFGHTTTGVTNRAAPDGGIGLEVDKFSRTAFDHHFEGMFGNLLPFLTSGNNGKVGIAIDSYEVGMQNWTSDFPSVFGKSRGYSLVKYLPAMTGRIVGSKKTTERFLWDVRRVQADLIAENYYGRCAEHCKKHGFYFTGEPYKLGPFENMQIGSKLDIAMGEFWARGLRNRHAVKLAASIQHINGKKIVAAESFTGHAIYSKWQQYPFSLKAQGDFMFTKGLNRLVFHTYPHQPHPEAKPGMTMGPFGTHIDRNVTWFEPGKAWLKYIARAQFLLQQGLFTADLLYFRGEEAPGVELALRDTISPEIPEGYDYDDINAEAVMQRVSIKQGRIVLPDGMNYRLMVMPEKNAMTFRFLQKIRTLVNEGMCILGSKPVEISGLTGYPQSDKEFRRMAEEIWGDLDGHKVRERAFGSGKVFWHDSVADVLKKMNVAPDFTYTSATPDPAINYIHRRVGDADVYMIANRKRRSENLVCSFRVENKRPEFWDADTGRIMAAPVFDIVDGRTIVPVQLDQAGSVFLVFRSQAKGNRIVLVKKDGVNILNAMPLAKHERGINKSITNNFTLEAWVKPESDIAMSGINVIRREDVSGFLFYPSAGEEIYGEGHAVCGVTAGLNGVVVYERRDFRINPVMEVEASLSGKTHVALVYENRQPKVYINGQLRGTGSTSEYIVHPSLNEEYQDAASAYFEGDRITEKLHKSAFGPEEIRQLVQKQPPSLATTFPKISFTEKLQEQLFWENGNYSLVSDTGKSATIQVSGIDRPLKLSGPWKVKFPPKSGAPESIVLTELQSLHLHETEGVRHFSGTARYQKQFNISRKDADSQLFLDLGQVEVLAEVVMNGRHLGIFWKRPYQIDITDAVRSGNNELEVRVTNLWPNRLIGDEHFPAENEYYDKEFEGQQGGGIKSLPKWYLNGEPKPAGPRTTFTTWKHYNKNSPLLESGLIGPVTLRMAVKKTYYLK